MSVQLRLSGEQFDHQLLLDNSVKVYESRSGVGEKGVLKWVLYLQRIPALHVSTGLGKRKVGGPACKIF